MRAHSNVSLAARLAVGRLGAAARRLHGNDTGAEEGMNKLLIFAMVALPLLALLIFFGTEIVGFAQEQWDTVFGSGGVEMP
jgi:hypothetical protein